MNQTPTADQPNFFMTKSVDKIANISIKELFAKYATYIPLILLCVILALTLAWIKLRYTQTTYKQTGRLY